MKGEADVDESSHNLDCIVMLGMIKEVSLAALIRGMPVKNIELRRSRRLILS